MSKEQKQVLGVSWLKFFCFWRPWISLVFTIMFLINLIGYEEYRIYYLSNGWGYLSTGMTFLNSILLVILFFMAKKRDSRTINFIGWILLLETISFSYNGIMQQATSLDHFIVMFIIMLVIIYFLWYRTNMKYFKKRVNWFNNNLSPKYVDEELEDELEDEADDEPEILYSKTKQNNTKMTKATKYCKLCGGKLDNNNKCKKCGKQYFKLKKSLILYLVIGGLVVSNILFIFMYVDKNNQLEDVIYGYDENDTWCETTMDMLTDGHTWSYTNEKLDFFDENIVFVIEGYGNYYYTYDCVQKITDGEEYSYWAYNKEAAKGNGYQKGTCY